jgi:hypothetical protein
MSAEEWRPIPGWPGYEVSDLGRVISHKRGLDRELRTFPGPAGHPRVQLTRSRKDRRTYFVHQLVMLAFVGPCPEGEEVRHLDGSRGNTLTNLRYGTRRENAQDALAHGVNYHASRTHCPRSHPYDETNTYRDARGWRACITCKNDSQREAARRRRGPRVVKATCPQDHLYDEMNTVIDARTGARRCRACRNAQAAASKRRTRNPQAEEAAVASIERAMSRANSELPG